MFNFGYKPKEKNTNVDSEILSESTKDSISDYCPICKNKLYNAGISKPYKAFNGYFDETCLIRCIDVIRNTKIEGARIFTIEGCTDKYIDYSQLIYPQYHSYFEKVVICDYTWLKLREIADYLIEKGTIFGSTSPKFLYSLVRGEIPSIIEIRDWSEDNRGSYAPFCPSRIRAAFL